MTGLDISDEDMAELLKVDPVVRKAEIGEMEKYFEQYGERLPDRIRKQL